MVQVQFVPAWGQRGARAVVLCSAMLAWPAAVRADEAASVGPATVDISQELKRIFSGAAPANVADLKAMQAHVQTLTDKLAKCTVGVEVGFAQGSGVIISKDGYVLTAAHVASPPRRRGQQAEDVPVTFYLADGRTVTGKVLGQYRTLDAGLLKITEPGDYPYAELGSSDGLHDGQWCVAMGHPGGYQEDRGLVLRLGRIVFHDKEAITTDCTLVGGDSGGPLFDMEGRVIGINSRIAEKLTANMHVPVAVYKESWDRLTKGEVWGHLPGRTPYLGVRGDESATNARIASVVPDSPAERAGLKPGDVVLKFAGREITDFKSLTQAVQDQEPRRFRRNPIAIQIRRGEETMELQVQLGIRDE